MKEVAPGEPSQARAGTNITRLNNGIILIKAIYCIYIEILRDFDKFC